MANAKLDLLLDSLPRELMLTRLETNDWGIWQMALKTSIRIKDTLHQLRIHSYDPQEHEKELHHQDSDTKEHRYEERTGTYDYTLHSGGRDTDIK